MATIIVFFAMR